MPTLEDHIDRVVHRAASFYRQTEPGHCLISVQFPVEAPPVPPLFEFDLDHQLEKWLDCRLAHERPLWRQKEGLDDDALPAICPQFGIAEHSAWLGMEVRFQEATCLPVPILRGPADLARLRCSEQDKWFRYMQAGYAYLRRQKDSDFLLSVRGTMAPMDIANAVRGDALFLDFLVDPDFAHALLAYLVEAVRWYYPRLCSWADAVAGSHVFHYNSSWMPPSAIGHLANDAAMLCSPGIYEKFGYPYELQLVNEYQSVLYHVHNEKMHHVPRLAELPGLALLEVTNDPKAPPAITDPPAPGHDPPRRLAGPPTAYPGRRHQRPSG
jgi:hypothetical protein